MLGKRLLARCPRPRAQLQQAEKDQGKHGGACGLSRRREWTGTSSMRPSRIRRIRFSLRSNFSFSCTGHSNTEAHGVTNAGRGRLDRRRGIDHDALASAGSQHCTARGRTAKRTEVEGGGNVHDPLVGGQSTSPRHPPPRCCHCRASLL